MIWTHYYLPHDYREGQAQNEAPPASCFFQLIQSINLLIEGPPAGSKDKLAFGLVGFCCDEESQQDNSHIGAKEGPLAIRRALAPLPIQKQNFQFFDVGNIICINKNLSASQQALGEVVALLLNKGIIPIVIGGGHELAWGHYQGMAHAYPDKHLGIINFTAHLDLLPLLPHKQGNSHTTFLQIAEAHQLSHRRLDYNCIGIQHAGNLPSLFEMAKKYGVKIIWADELQQGQLEKCVDFVDRIIDQNEIVYLSVCLNAFAAAFVPGVSAPQPLGLLPWQVIPLIRLLAASGKVVAYDIAGMSPQHDTDECTAKLAANLIYEFIHHHNEQPRAW